MIIENCHKLISPRLVALITTVDKEGRINAMPASWIMNVNFTPPIVMLAVGHTRDTYKNISEVPEFVINILSKEHKDKVLKCSYPYQRGVNELEKVGLHWIESKSIKPPRVEEARTWLECKVIKKTEFYDHAAIFGEVVACGGESDIKKIDTFYHVTGNVFASDFKIIKHG